MIRILIIFTLISSAAFCGDNMIRYTIKFLDKKEENRFGLWAVSDYKGDTTHYVKKQIPADTGVMISDLDNNKSEIFSKYKNLLLEIDGEKMTTVEQVVNWFKTAEPGRHKMKVILYYNKNHKKFWTKEKTISFAFTEVVDPVPEKPKEPEK